MIIKLPTSQLTKKERRRERKKSEKKSVNKKGKRTKNKDGEPIRTEEKMVERRESREKVSVANVWMIRDANGRTIVESLKEEESTGRGTEILGQDEVETKTEERVVENKGGREEKQQSDNRTSKRGKIKVSKIPKKFK